MSPTNHIIHLSLPLSDTELSTCKVVPYSKSKKPNHFSVSSFSPSASFSELETFALDILHNNCAKDGILGHTVNNNFDIPTYLCVKKC